MQMTEEGLALIRRFEGFRASAYKCPAGIWTIGYGHTESAGPPAVVNGMTVSIAEAERILAADVANFAKGVAALLTQPLNVRQFSALVSFAYNVGLGNFRGSSVRAAVNAGDFAAVPRRLQLWVRGGGRVLPGLVARRAAEAALFVSEGEDPPSRIDASAMSPVQAKPATRSTTIAAAVIAALAAMAGSLLPANSAATAALSAAAAAWVIRERLRRLRDDAI